MFRGKLALEEAMDLSKTDYEINEASFLPTSLDYQQRCENPDLAPSRAPSQQQPNHCCQLYSYSQNCRWSFFKHGWTFDFPI
jgi:hypothetical protein